MIKLVFLCRRRPDISHTQYVDRLLRGHVPIALRHHPTLRRYVVNVVEASPFGGPALDSIGELSFDTLEDFHERLYDTPEGERVVHADVRRFMGGAQAYIVDERVVRGRAVAWPLGTRSPGHKLVTCLRRRPELTPAAFATDWLERHAPLVVGSGRTVAQYVANLVVGRPDGRPPEWDGFEQIHLPAGVGVAAGFGAEAARTAASEDRAQFVAHAASYGVAEYVQRLPGETR
jgi:hypothetical protein